MSWIQPKTDWVATDFFNATDYNRIVNNLYYLKQLAEELFTKFDYLDMEKEKNYYSTWFASEMNKIEDNLETLNFNTVILDVGDKKVYAVNGNVPDNVEWNRIESAELLIFNALFGRLSTMQHLEIVLGGDRQIGKRVRYADGEMIAHRLNFKLGIGNGGLI